MDIKDVVGGVIGFVIGVYILKIMTSTLEIPFGTIIIAAFVAGGIIWFIKEVMGR